MFIYVVHHIVEHTNQHHCFIYIKFIKTAHNNRFEKKINFFNSFYLKKKITNQALTNANVFFCFTCHQSVYLFAHIEREMLIKHINYKTQLSVSISWKKNHKFTIQTYKINIVHCLIGFLNEKFLYKNN